MIALNAVVADGDDEAEFLFNSHRRMFRDVRRGRPGQLRAPLADLELGAQEAAGLEQMLWGSAVGSPGTVRDRLLGFREQTGADEFVFTSQIFDRDASLRSYELLAQVRESLADAAVR
jgi:alkanesulfonate monooxygenase SsuD/methylene tetrahydromethanopterin reductase-like flavin-dependent oxidoreductase (luciferase family)